MVPNDDEPFDCSVHNRKEKEDFCLLGLVKVLSHETASVVLPPTASLKSASD